jgi:HEPN domain-containing protein
VVEHEAIRSYQALSEEYLAAAEAVAAAGHLAPAYHNALHALELAVKAALASRLPRVPRTHNVGGLLGQEFLDELGADVCARVNRLVHAYDAPRYPDWEAPPDARDDLAFIATFVRGRLPRLLAEGRA